MKKSKIRLILLIVASVALIVSLTIGGTLAWLTASAAPLKNTFTVGDITMNIKETPVGGGEKASAGNEYQIIPGAKIGKDPTITIEKDSQECYVYAGVKTNIDNYIKSWEVDSDIWTLVKKDDTAADGTIIYIYKYVSTVDASEKDEILPAIFDSVTFKGAEITATSLPADGYIKVAGYAHQSENLDTDTRTGLDAVATAHFTTTVKW